MADREEELDVRRKRLQFRSWHRGIRELDLLTGPFADRYVPGFTAEQLDEFEALLLQSDPDIYNWLVGHEPIPEAFDNEIVGLMKNFIQDSRKA
mgnify:CR=1 FL=1|jgi:antitoxin CptB|tara:strand:- start:355 stop:636 length:282 start_codon:yes stop_codon:yes gene_type:complete